MTSADNRPLRVFLCHSSADKPAVRELYQKLCAEPWIEPWLDEEEIFPGMDWNMEIEKNIEETDVIIVCLSNSSITKEGYVQKEIKTALDFSDYKPEGTVFIIPVRLEDCKPPSRLSRWQYEDYFADKRNRALERLFVSLKKRAESLGLKTEENNFIPPTAEWITLNKIVLSNSMEFMCVPKGKFLMGSSKENKLALPNEYSQHIVDIPYDYWMARFPITNELYNFYITKTSSNHPVPDWDSKRKHPVVSVALERAEEYCAWLNSLLRRELPLNMMVRLPTEAEWEKSARGSDGREFPWGNQFDSNKCNTSESGVDDTTPVGLYSPQSDSPYGCVDMSGNVFERTHSRLREYPYKVTDGREIQKGNRVLRGGSFTNGGRSARCAARFGFVGNIGEAVGFRVCIAPPLPYHFRWEK